MPPFSLSGLSHHLMCKSIFWPLHTNNIKIYTVSSAFRGPEHILLLKQCLEGEGIEWQAEMEWSALHSPFAPPGHNIYNKNWETYIISEGIKQDGHADHFLLIPMQPHHPNHNILQLQPWYQWMAKSHHRKRVFSVSTTVSNLVLLNL